RSNDPDGEVGLNLKYSVTRGLTLDATYNTDFAQVEDDEQRVNLTRFSLFFPEKREFFLGGQGIFAIGAGARLTGKVGPYSVGLLNIQTGEQRAADASATNFSVVRIKRDFLRRSTIGALAALRAPGTDAAGSA